MRLRNLEEVCITPFPPEYRLQTFEIFRRHNDPLQHLRRFKWQCWATIENNALRLKQFMMSLGGIAYSWYCTLDEILIPTWMVMLKRFLKEQSTFRYNPKFLRNLAANEIRRIDHLSWNPFPDVKMTATWCSYRRRWEWRGFLVYVIQLKCVAKKSEPRYKSLARSKPDWSRSLPKSPYQFLKRRSYQISNFRSCWHQNHPEHI